MSISSMMRTATSGMNAQSNRLSSISDNIANATTNGYKRSHIEFSSFIPNRSTFEYQSGSVTSNVRTFVSEQGTITTTQSATDLAVKGNGLFLVSNTNGDVYFTRAGSFVKDGEGNLQNAAGFYLMGYPYVNGVPTPPVANGTQGLQQVKITDLVMQAELSTTGTVTVNVNADAPIIPAANLPSLNLATSQFNAKTSLVVYGNQGEKITLDMYWAKTATDTWELTVFSPPVPPGSFPYAAGPITTQTVTFDATTGVITNPMSINVVVPNGANPLVLDLSKSSQLAFPYTEQTVSVNGSGPAAVDRVEVDTNGTLYAIYQNGIRVPVFDIPLATAPSPDNLLPLAGDVFTTSQNSGDMLIGVPGVGGFGTIQGTSLEQSKVDLATELADMIESQRNYQMNAKVFQASADLLDVLVNLPR